MCGVCWGRDGERCNGGVGGNGGWGGGGLRRVGSDWG